MSLSEYYSIKEFFSTESMHYENLIELSRMIAFFTVPLEENRELPENSMAYKQLQDLFANPLMEADAKKELLEQLKEFKKTLDEYLSVIEAFATRCKDKKDDITVADVKDFASDRTIQCLVAVLIAAQSVKYLLETKYKVENAMSLSGRLILPTQRATKYGLLSKEISGESPNVSNLLGNDGLAKSALVADAILLLLEKEQQLRQFGIKVLEFSEDIEQKEKIIENVLALHRQDRREDGPLKHLGEMSDDEALLQRNALSEALDMLQKNQHIKKVASKHLSLMEKKENVSGISYLRNMMSQARKGFSFSRLGKTELSSPPERKRSRRTKSKTSIHPRRPGN